MPLVLPSTVQDPTTGQVATAAWGDAVNDAIAYATGGFPHASILESSVQSIANATGTNMTSNEENSDIGGMHSTSSNTDRLVVPAGEGGLYRFSAVDEFAFDVDGYREILFRKNDTTNNKAMAVPPVTTGSGNTTLSGSRTFVLVAGDWISNHVFHTAGNALNVTMLDFSAEWRATA